MRAVFGESLLPRRRKNEMSVGGDGAGGTTGTTATEEAPASHQGAETEPKGEAKPEPLLASMGKARKCEEGQAHTLGQFE